MAPPSPEMAAPPAGAWAARGAPRPGAGRGSARQPRHALALGLALWALLGAGVQGHPRHTLRLSRRLLEVRPVEEGQLLLLGFAPCSLKGHFPTASARVDTDTCCSVELGTCNVEVLAPGFAPWLGGTDEPQQGSSGTLSRGARALLQDQRKVFSFPAFRKHARHQDGVLCPSSAASWQFYAPAYSGPLPFPSVVPSALLTLTFSF